MSHTMNIQLEIKDIDTLLSACERLNLRVEKNGKHQLFASEEEGVAVYLPGWSYPVVFKQDGSVAYDNYNGEWGNIEELHKLTAWYGFFKAKAEAQIQGYSTYENLDDEVIQLRIEIGG